MNVIAKLWNDECGAILSAEAVMVGTVAVVGLTTGLSQVSSAVNEELKDFAFAIRSLDQSYCIPAQRGCCSYTAGSCFKQQDVDKSLEELTLLGDQVEAEFEEVQARSRQSSTSKASTKRNEAARKRTEEQKKREDSRKAELKKKAEAKKKADAKKKAEDRKKKKD